MAMNIKLPKTTSFALLCGYIANLRRSIEILSEAVDNKVDETRTVNGKALSSDLTLTQVVDITIAVSSWKANTDTATKSLGYAYVADVAVSGLAAADSTHTDFSVASLSAATSAGVSGGADVLTGTMRYYAASIPKAALSARLTITKA